MMHGEAVEKQDKNCNSECEVNRNQPAKIVGPNTESSCYYIERSTVNNYTLSNVSDDGLPIGTADCNKFARFFSIYALTFVLVAIMFCWSESSVERNDVHEFYVAQKKFLARNPGVDLDSLNELMDAAEKARSKGLSIKFVTLLEGTSDDLDPESKHIERPQFANGQSTRWEITSSLLFVASIATTIGYGNVSPSTEAGKILCMLFGIVGIPATVYMLLSVVKMLLKGPVNLLESLVVLSIYRVRYCVSLRAIQILHFLIVLLVVVIIAFLIPACIFWRLENWTFLDSFYYCFISLTTVGLGDFVPGANPLTSSVTYRLGIMLYMFFGILMVMLLIVVVKRIPCFNFEKILRLEDIRRTTMTAERIRIITQADEERLLDPNFVKPKLYGTYPQPFVSHLIP